MRLTHEEEGSYAAVAISGRLDAVTSPQAETELKAILEKRPPAIILDLSELEYVSSAGLRILLVAAKTVKQNDTTLVLCGLKGTVSDVIQMSGFTRIFDIVATREEAVARLQ